MTVDELLAELGRYEDGAGRGVAYSTDLVVVLCRALRAALVGLDDDYDNGVAIQCAILDAWED